VTVYRSNDEHTYLDGGSPALLDSLPEDRARALLHILDCGKALEKAAVLSGSLRRTLRLGHPGLQTLPWT
jgi:hypothetical protein